VVPYDQTTLPPPPLAAQPLNPLTLSRRRRLFPANVRPSSLTATGAFSVVDHRVPVRTTDLPHHQPERGRRRREREKEKEKEKARARERDRARGREKKEGKDRGGDRGRGRGCRGVGVTWTHVRTYVRVHPENPLFPSAFRSHVFPRDLLVQAYKDNVPPGSVLQHHRS